MLIPQEEGRKRPSSSPCTDEMSFIRTALTRFVTEQDAVSSTEYALLAVLIGVASAVVLALLSANVHQLYAEICAAVTSAVSGNARC